MKNYEEKGRKGFTLTKDDFDWEFFPAGGNGGQKQNKTSSACRCTHRPSNSVGISRDERSQSQNKKLAFQRCCGTESFKKWSKLELTRQQMKNDEVVSVEDQVARDLLPHNIKVERFDTATNQWVETAF